MRYSVHGGQLWADSTPLGPADRIYADGKKQTPGRLDFVFAAKDKVVGVESKTVQDLISSWIARRLQRQLREMRSMVDVPCLMLRGLDSYYDMDDYPDIAVDLVKWQLLDGEPFGPGLVLFGPKGDPMKYLTTVQAVMSGQRNLNTIVAGSDSTRIKGKNKRELSLQRAIPNVGPKTAARLAAEVGNLADVLLADDEVLTKAGANAKVLAGIREALA